MAVLFADALRAAGARAEQALQFTHGVGDGFAAGPLSLSGDLKALPRLDDF